MNHVSILPHQYDLHTLLYVSNTKAYGVQSIFQILRKGEGMRRKTFIADHLRMLVEQLPVGIKDSSVEFLRYIAAHFKLDDAFGGVGADLIDDEVFGIEYPN